MTKAARDPLYHRHRHRHRHRFPLSLRMVEDLLAARGIVVSHQTVRLWVEKFGRDFAREIRRRSAGQESTKQRLQISMRPDGDHRPAA
jgi:putative transposase